MLNLLFGFIFGTVLGSFVDCIANRALTKKSFWGRSFCDTCKKPLAWYDLIPVLSFLWNKGKCRFCKSKIPAETIIVEILMGSLIALLFSQSAPLTQLSLNPLAILQISDILFNAFTVSVLVTVFITDIKTGLIPDRITFPSIAISFAYLILSSIYKVFLQYQSLIQSPLGKFLLPPHSDYFYRHAFLAITPLWSGILAGLIVGGFFLALIILTKGRGMGGGDFKLGIFLGLVFGIEKSLLVLMLSFLGGSIVGIILILIGKRKFGQTIPFGPFLSLGALVTLFWGDQLLKWYINLKLS